MASQGKEEKTKSTNFMAKLAALAGKTCRKNQFRTAPFMRKLCLPTG
jgi:hypothetical protein